MAKLAAERLDQRRGRDRAAEADPRGRSAARPGVLDALEKQAEREKDFGTVAEVLERRVDAAPDDSARLVALQKLGAVYAERLKDPAAAARTWRRVLALSPGHAKALRVLRESYVAASDWDGLEELYASQSDWEGLVDFLSGAADKATDRRRSSSTSRSARRASSRSSWGRPSAPRARTSACSAWRRGDARAAAALVPIYEKEEKWARLPALYEVLLGGERRTRRSKVAHPAQARRR